MASTPPTNGALGFPQRLADYVIAGGREVNAYALGYQQAGRFGWDGPPEFTDAQQAAYNQAVGERKEDDAAPSLVTEA